MHSGIIATVDADTGTVNLGKSVNVVKLSSRVRF